LSSSFSPFLKISCVIVDFLTKTISLNCGEIMEKLWDCCGDVVNGLQWTRKYIIFYNTQAGAAQELCYSAIEIEKTMSSG
jgi:hypothetical protein